MPPGSKSKAHRLIKSSLASRAKTTIACEEKYCIPFGENTCVEVYPILENRQHVMLCFQEEFGFSAAKYWLWQACSGNVLSLSRKYYG
jgi:hypothetical protein